MLSKGPWWDTARGLRPPAGTPGSSSAPWLCNRPLPGQVAGSPSPTQGAPAISHRCTTAPPGRAHVVVSAWALENSTDPCIHTETHMRTQPCMHMHTHTQIHMRTHTHWPPHRPPPQTHTHIQIYARAHTHTHRATYARAHSQSHTHTDAPHIYIHPHTVCTHTHPHLQIHTRMHTDLPLYI